MVPSRYIVPFCLLLLGSKTEATATSNATPAAYRLVSATRIRTTPHAWLEKRRVYFTLPAGWTARSLPPDKHDEPGWWINNWNKAGISWRLRPANALAKPIYCDFDILMAPGNHSDTWRPGDEENVQGRYGLNGFTYIRSYNPGFETRWFILQVPHEKARRYTGKYGSLFLVCSAEYPTKERAQVTPAIEALIRSCSVHR